MLSKKLKSIFILMNLWVHWDGKLLEDLVGKKHVDCLPTLVSRHGISELLGVPKLVSGTGEMVATVVFNTITGWGISDQVSVMSFDTTASNIGHCAGACLLLEKKLGKSLLHLACRHHIMELVPGNAFGKSSSPNVILFKRFQKKWAFIDQSCYQLGPTDEHLKKHILLVLADILSFANAEFRVKHPRDDYRELLELTIILLRESLPGGVVLSVQVHSIMLAGCQKCCIASRFGFFVTNLTSQRKKRLESEKCLFCSLFYVRSWMKCSLLTEAP